MVTLSQFGAQLRGHRKRRGVSQLDLAVRAGTTARYVSFIETGRSRPGPGVVLKIADALELGLRERNALFVAAGLPPAHPELAADDVALEPIWRIVEHVLDNHDPYPGFAMGPGFQVRLMNRAAEALFPGIRDMEIADIVATWFPGESVDAEPAVVPVMTPTVIFDGRPVRTITTAMRFDHAIDVTTSELLVELMFPADPEAEAFFRARG
jgi:transcriptional regulator with XRE-family HTH domain